jgi:ATP-dependent exoDNAse (exonuclease V) beta subunit
VCRPDDRATDTETPQAVSFAPGDRTPLSAAEDSNATVAWNVDEAAYEPPSAGSRSDRLTGTIVHRLFQRRVAPDTPEPDVAVLASRIVTPEERAEVEDISAAAQRAAALYLRFRRRHDVATLLEAGRVEYEVPISVRLPSGTGFVQRAIDCVVIAPDGGLTVLEFKTGSARREHRQQAALYAAALAAACPGRPVDVKILYPDSEG